MSCNYNITGEYVCASVKKERFGNTKPSTRVVGRGKITFDGFANTKSSTRVVGRGKITFDGFANTTGSITSPASLKVGDGILSNNGQYIAINQTDGHFCVNRTSDNGALACYGPYNGDGSGFTPGHIDMQTDGNLCNYSGSGKGNWCNYSNGKGTGPYNLTLNDDGSLVIIDANDTQIWN